MRIEIYGRANRDICDAISATWQRLPRDVRQQLDHVVFTTGQHARKSWASAGPADIDISTALPTTKATIGLISHEVAHVALGHAGMLRRGEITAQEAERQADRLARQWGFGDEIHEAYSWR